jgi:hypothetical protein
LPGFATSDLSPSFFGEINPPHRFNVNLRNDGASLPAGGKTFCLPGQYKKNELCDADTEFFCELRVILGKKFDTLKMTVGNVDFWNEAKLKSD